jgi:hypothetical protein
MLAYLVRRIAYAIPILIGVNLLTFALFFFVNSPDDMARMQLGQKRVTPEAIQKWKADRGYDKPMMFDSAAPGWTRLTTRCSSTNPRACSPSISAARGRAQHRPRDQDAHVAEPRDHLAGFLIGCSPASASR